MECHHVALRLLGGFHGAGDVLGFRSSGFLVPNAMTFRGFVVPKMERKPLGQKVLSKLFQRTRNYQFGEPSSHVAPFEFHLLLFMTNIAIRGTSLIKFHDFK
jgi:hypothetical protein